MANNSITGAAISGHPNWGVPRPITRPVAPPRPTGIASAGSGILAPPKPRGIAAAGTALLGTPANPASALTQPSGQPWNGANPPRAAGSPGTPGNPAAPAPPDLSGNKWQGYLTPDQLGALGTAGNAYSTGISNWTAQSGLQLDANGNPIVDANGNPVLNQSGQAEIQYNQANAQAQYAHDVNQQQAIEQMAARGLSVSGVRDNDLTDINRTLVDTQAQATQTLNTLIGEATRAIAGLNANWNTAQIQGQGEAAVNAIPTQAAPTPVQPGAGPGGAALPGAAAAPAPAPTSKPAPPSKPQGSTNIIRQAIKGHPLWGKR